MRYCHLNPWESRLWHRIRGNLGYGYPVGSPVGNAVGSSRGTEEISKAAEVLQHTPSAPTYWRAEHSQ